MNTNAASNSFKVNWLCIEYLAEVLELEASSNQLAGVIKQLFSAGRLVAIESLDTAVLKFLAELKQLLQSISPKHFFAQSTSLSSDYTNSSWEAWKDLILIVRNLTPGRVESVNQMYDVQAADDLPTIALGVRTTPASAAPTMMLEWQHPFAGLPHLSAANGDAAYCKPSTQLYSAIITSCFQHLTDLRLRGCSSMEFRFDRDVFRTVRAASDVSGDGRDYVYLVGWIAKRTLDTVSSRSQFQYLFPRLPIEDWPKFSNNLRTAASLLGHENLSAQKMSGQHRRTVFLASESAIRATRFLDTVTCCWFTSQSFSRFGAEALAIVRRAFASDSMLHFLMSKFFDASSQTSVDLNCLQFVLATFIHFYVKSAQKSCCAFYDLKPSAKPSTAVRLQLLGISDKVKSNAKNVQ